VKMLHRIMLVCGLLSVSISSAYAQKAATLSPVRQLSYADIVDMALAGQLAVQVRIRTAKRISGAQAKTVLPGRKRFLIAADVMTLIRGTGGLAPRIAYLIDVAPDAKGKMPKLTGGQALIFASAVPGQPGEVRLVSPDAQIAATPARIQQIRSILLEASAENAPPAITGVGNAFHVAGAIPGEGETQIFLETAQGRPVSLSVIRTASAAPLWSVSLGEIVDQGAGPPVKNTLLWYRLACFLPNVLPESSFVDVSPESAQIAAEDYRTILEGLGGCLRTLAIRPST
jgi:hypothetical protein